MGAGALVAPHPKQKKKLLGECFQSLAEFGGSFVVIAGVAIQHDCNSVCRGKVVG